MFLRTVKRPREFIVPPLTAGLHGAPREREREKVQAVSFQMLEVSQISGGSKTSRSSVLFWIPNIHLKVWKIMCCVLRRPLLVLHVREQHCSGENFFKSRATVRVPAFKNLIFTSGKASVAEGESGSQSHA